MHFLMRHDTVREVEREMLLALVRPTAIHLERAHSVANEFLKWCPTHVAEKSLKTFQYE